MWCPPNGESLSLTKLYGLEAVILKSILKHPTAPGCFYYPKINLRSQCGGFYVGCVLFSKRVELALNRRQVALDNTTSGGVIKLVTIKEEGWGGMNANAFSEGLVK